MALSERERAILDFEGSWWTHEGTKARLIGERFQCSADAYYQQLIQVLEHPDALAYDPLVVRRLARLRDQWRRARLDDLAASEGNHA